MVKANTYNKWSQEELDKLKKLYEVDGLSLSEIVDILHRTNASVCVKIKRLKLRHTKEQTTQIKKRILSGKGNGMFGKEGPNKGLTKETCERIKENARKQSETMKRLFKEGIFDKEKIRGKNNGMYGKIPWNKGLTAEICPKILERNKKLSIIRKEKWKLLSEEEKERRRTVWAMQSTKKKNYRSSIEDRIEELLIKNNIEYKHSFAFKRFVLDFFIPSKNICIEVNGDYWHGNPKIYNSFDKHQLKNKERDNRKKELLKKHGIELFVLWEYDIRNFIYFVDNFILKTIRN